VPAATPGDAVNVSVELPELPAMVVEVKEAVTPAGIPLAVNVRSPAPPLTGVAVMTVEKFPEAAADTEPCAGATEPLKSQALLLTPR
jgi:hypothetical protein